MRSFSSILWVKRFKGFSNAITNNPKNTVKMTIPEKIVYSPKCSDFSPKIPATLYFNEHRHLGYHSFK